MRRFFIIFFAAVVSIAAMAQNENYFYSDIKCNARLGYSIGGNAPMPMPATIRSLNSFKLQPNISFGADIYKPLRGGKWGLQFGIQFENKGMHTDADVKNYNMEMTREGQSIEGWFTGKVDTQVKQGMFTFHLQGVYNISPKVRLRLGPYLSYLTQRQFKGYAYHGYLRTGDPTGTKVEIGDDEESRGLYDFSEHMKKTQLGVDIGADWLFAKRVGAYADLAWGITGTFEKDFKTIEQILYPIYGTIGVYYVIR